MVEWELHDDTAAVFELDDQRTFEWGSSEYIEIIGGGVAEYEGPYESTPTWSVQMYQTRDKLMLDDFKVNGILELEVPNDAGGLTLTI